MKKKAKTNELIIHNVLDSLESYFQKFSLRVWSYNPQPSSVAVRKQKNLF